ncbi:hypothetical protein [Streptomyces albogriseolus]|uniref:hypothetical protein n=1 Tax=Streptomyces albogriseolus TaxID=1887 RepID=UPI0036CF1558
MATTDDYGQGVSVASLADAPNAEALARNIANAIVKQTIMRFNSASNRNATITSPEEGMMAWLRDTDLLTVYTGTAWLPFLGTTVGAKANDGYEAKATSYTTAFTAGSYEHCGISWVAPLSGKVKITVGARVQNSSTAGSLVSPETRLGSTLGSGAIVETPTDSIGFSHYGVTYARGTAAHLLTGLTPGASYNTRLLHRCSVTGETAYFAFREVIVEPVS